jgi:pantetheine-phosphate adenylyltransferase
MSTSLTPSDAYRTAVFTGTFDPISLGHLDVIERGRAIFDHLVVAIGINVNNASLFDVDERVQMVRQVLRPFPNVTVESFEGLAVKFVRKIGARVILRGLRTLSDMEYEFGMTLTNNRLDPEVETVFLMAGAEFSHVSSTLVKQVAYFGGADELRKFVPEALVGPILAKVANTVSVGSLG